MKLFAGLLATGLAVASGIAPAAEPGNDSRDRASPYVESIASALGAQVAGTVARIDGTGRRLLALRSYLRSGSRLAERWSWDDRQIAEYEQSPEYRDLQAEIDRVRHAFKQANPGTDLWVNPQVRSLDVQIEHWNTNQSVEEAAANLLAAAEEFVSADKFPASQPEKARNALEGFLAGHTPTPAPTIAAPGLSPHGQMRAVDFQVEKDGKIVAGPKTATIVTDWDEAGWTVRLEEAVRAGSNQFVGPLVSPREPWHYTYAPEAVAAR